MYFITFEGVEGSGKTTQINLLLEWLRARDERILHTREPGGTRIGDGIRDILLHPDNTEMMAEAEILLFSAARAQIVREVILPHLQQGWIVMCDRFYDSTLAYQGYGHNLDIEALQRITTFATGGLVPDLTLYLDIGVHEGLQRKAMTPEEWNRMEAHSLAYHQRVRNGYLALASQEPERWRIIDANRPVTVIQAHIQAEVLKLLIAGETTPS